MKLYTLFHEENLLVHSEATDLDQVVRSLLETLKPHLEKLGTEALVERLMDREMKHPTLIGEQACIVHRRIEGLHAFLVALAVLETPVPHPVEPAEKIRLVFLILSPQGQNTLMLQTMAAIARLLSTKTFMHAVKGVRSGGRVIRLIEESGIEVKRNLTASDIMEKIGSSVTLDTPLMDAVEILTKSRDEGLPVLDEKGHLAGEITTREILLLGMPKYMDLLANPEMLNAFEPFENYFLNEYKTHVRDICRRDFVTVPPNELVVRVAHLMITANRRRIYVMNDGELEGIIYRKSILQQVMNR